MKRYLCPNHAHLLTGKHKTIQLSSEHCTVCKWQNRPYTLKDFSAELKEISERMQFAADDETYDPFGFTYAQQFDNIIIEWYKSIHPSYMKTSIDKLLQELSYEKK
jgi:hypothetical protein